MKNSSQNQQKSVREASGRPWGGLGASFGPWKGFGDALEGTWGVLGMALGTLWKPLGALWAPFGRPWKPFGDFGEPWGAFLGKSFQGKACYMIFARFLSNFRRFLDVFFSQTVSKT